MRNSVQRGGEGGWFTLDQELLTLTLDQELLTCPSPCAKSVLTLSPIPEARTVGQPSPPDQTSTVVNPPEKELLFPVQELFTIDLLLPPDQDLLALRHPMGQGDTPDRVKDRVAPYPPFRMRTGPLSVLSHNVHLQCKMFLHCKRFTACCFYRL